MKALFKTVFFICQKRKTCKLLTGKNSTQDRRFLEFAPFFKKKVHGKVNWPPATLHLQSIISGRSWILSGVNLFSTPCTSRPGCEITEKFQDGGWRQTFSPREAFFKTLEEGVRVKLERIQWKNEKCAEGRMHPIEVSTKFLRMRWLLALKLTVFMKCLHLLCRSPREIKVATR